MASSGNFCTWSPLLGIKDDGSKGLTTSLGNCKATHSHNGIATLGTLSVKTGKWYWEVHYSASSDFSDGHLICGWQSLKNNVDFAYIRQQPGSGAGAPDRYNWGSHLMNYKGSGTQVYQGGYISSYNDVNNDTYDGAYNLGLRVGTAGKILQYAGDFDNNKLYFGIDNTWYSLANSGTGTDAANTDSGTFNATYGWSIESTWQGHHWIPAIWFSGASSGSIGIGNWGQDSSFAGTKSTGTAAAADGNGFGDFFYAPPSGYLALCTANLPISEDIDPNETDDDHPQKQFGILTYTGNGTSNNAISGLGFQPDLVWTKNRSNTADYSNALVDSSRGRAKVLYSHRTDKQPTDSTSTQDLKSFDSDGFTVGTGQNASVNASTHTYVGWCWKCDGGTTATNTSGTATSSVQVNTKAGFSICLTDNYTSGTGVTIGHGLGAKPTFYIHKPTGDNSSGGASQAFNWHVYHHSLGATKALFLNLVNRDATAIGYWNNTEPTSTVLSLGNTIAGNGQSLVYAWTDIEGYSKFGRYEGNGATDGAFVYTGFKPRMVFLKQIDGAAEWAVYDTARDTGNMAERCLEWDLNAAEKNSTNLSTDGIDFLSNGFKFRGGGGGRTNQSGRTYVFGAWADVPFKYNNAF